MSPKRASTAKAKAKGKGKAQANAKEIAVDTSAATAIDSEEVGATSTTNDGDTPHVDETLAGAIAVFNPRAKAKAKADAGSARDGSATVSKHLMWQRLKTAIERDAPPHILKMYNDVRAETQWRSGKRKRLNEILESWQQGLAMKEQGLIDSEWDCGEFEQLLAVEDTCPK